MPEKDPNNYQLAGSAIAFAFAMGGAALAYVRNLRIKKLAFNWFDLILRMLTGGFMGFLAIAATSGMGYAESVQGVVAGVAGMFSEQIVRLLEAWVFKVAKDKFGVELDAKQSSTQCEVKDHEQSGKD